MSSFRLRGSEGTAAHHGGEGVAKFTAAKTDREAKIRKQEGKQERPQSPKTPVPPVSQVP